MSRRQTLRRAAAQSKLSDLRDRVGRRPLEQLGRSAGLPGASAGALRSIERAIAHRRVRSIAIVTTETSRVLGAVFARRYPSAQVHVFDTGTASTSAPSARRRVTLHHTPTLDTVHRALSSLPPVDVLVDLSAVGRPPRLRHMLFHLADGGLYLIDELAPAAAGSPAKPDRPAAGTDGDVRRTISRLLEVKADLAGHRTGTWHPDDVARADAIASVTHDGSTIAIAKVGRHLLKLHDAEAETVLLGRNGEGWGRRLEVREALTVQARGTWRSNVAQDAFRTQMQVPPLYLREYHGVVCAPRQLAVQGDLVLPISFHHALRGRLQQRSPLLHSTGSHYATLLEPLDDAHTLAGAYFHFDSEFPGHFGHVLTEDIAKLWGYDAARVHHPGLKVLVSTLEPDGGPSTIQRAMLSAWGVADEDIVCITAPVRVELLVGATQMFYNGTYVHPELEQVWDRLRDALRSPEAERRPTPPRLFVSRDPEELRRCTNGAQVEALFVEHGFAAIRPELLSVREQVDLFAGADVVAGYGGSGMFTAMFSDRPGRRIVIASENYTARNEWTISALRGDEYHHFTCPAVYREAPDPSRPHEKFHSPFEFDFERDGDALRALLTG